MTRLLSRDFLRRRRLISEQDLVSRFTLDSATSFLFGHDVHSLAAGLAYPKAAVAASAAAAERNKSILAHPANIFAHSFLEAQRITAHRSRFGTSWPLREFWKDDTKVRALPEPKDVNMQD